MANDSTYGDTERVKNVLDEQGQTANDAKIQFYHDKASRDMDKEFIYILSDTTPFPNPPQWLQTLTEARAIALFWFHENNDDTLLKQNNNDIEQEREKRFKQPKARTR